MAVATRQKSTARRLVSVFAVREITNKMLFGLTPAVTSEAPRCRPNGRKTPVRDHSAPVPQAGPGATAAPARPGVLAVPSAAITSA